MKLIVNNEEIEVKDGCTLAELATQLSIPNKGVAIAVAKRMIPHQLWESHVLQPEDNLVVIKAACGG